MPSPLERRTNVLIFHAKDFCNPYCSARGFRLLPVLRGARWAAQVRHKMRLPHREIAAGIFGAHPNLKRALLAKTSERAGFGKLLLFGKQNKIRALWLPLVGKKNSKEAGGSA